MTRQGNSFMRSPIHIVVHICKCCVNVVTTRSLQIADISGGDMGWITDILTAIQFWCKRDEQGWEAYRRRRTNCRGWFSSWILKLFFLLLIADKDTFYEEELSFFCFDQSGGWLIQVDLIRGEERKNLVVDYASDLIAEINCTFGSKCVRMCALRAHF